MQDPSNQENHQKKTLAQISNTNFPQGNLAMKPTNQYCKDRKTHEIKKTKKQDCKTHETKKTQKKNQKKTRLQDP